MSMIKFYRKTICLWLAVILTLSSSCFYGEETGAYFDASIAHDSTAQLTRADTFSKSDILNAEEVSTIKNAGNITVISIKSLREKQCENMHLFSILLAVRPDIHTYFNEMINMVAMDSSSSQNVIIHYIQKQDGAKA